MSLISRLYIAPLIIISLQGGTVGGRPVMERNEIDAMIFEDIKGILNCPPDQFFSFGSKDCKDCGHYCTNGTGEATCQRQCKAHFLEIESKKKDAKINQLENDIKSSKGSQTSDDGGVGKIVWGFGIAIAVFSVFSIITSWWIICRSRKRFEDQRNAQYEFQTAKPIVDREAEEGTVQGYTAGRPSE